MSRIQTQTEEKKETTYNLSDPREREIIKDFEEMINGRSWETYCYDMGYMVKNSRYPTGAVVKSRLENYFQDREKWRAMEVLRERRKYAHRQEHLTNLQAIGLEECPDKPDTECRCSICYPITLGEIIKERGIFQTF